MRHLLLLLLAVAVTSCSERGQTPGGDAEAALDTTASPVFRRVQQEIEALDAMRSTLARSIPEGPVDSTTFARVCRPVGARAKQLSTETGWQVSQLARKYRNPANRADAATIRAMNRFEDSPGLSGFWAPPHRGVEGGARYFRRITVEKACLSCHGKRATRPAFIVEKYPEDSAFEFAEGDLRGVYSVFVPDSLLSAP